MIRVGVVGVGTIGKRVADAIARQDDIELSGVAEIKLEHETFSAASKGYRLYTLPDRVKKFEEAGLKVYGTIEDLVKSVDVVIDATPEGVGAENKRQYYEPNGVRAIFQGGEKADVAGVSFNALANYEAAIGKKYVRVVSCNTTNIIRIITALANGNVEYKKVRVFIARRGADPKEYKKGPINDIVPNPAGAPSHHALDVKTILPSVDIVSMAVAVPVTISHMHMFYIELSDHVPKERIIDAFAKTPRIMLVSTKHGYVSAAQVIEWARDMGRPRGDVWESIVIEDSITVMDRELYLMAVTHQESIVVPENVDAVRAMIGVVDKWSSMRKTDEALGLITNGKRYGT